MERSFVLFLSHCGCPCPWVIGLIRWTFPLFTLLVILAFIIIHVPILVYKHSLHCDLMEIFGLCCDIYTLPVDQIFFLMQGTCIKNQRLPYLEWWLFQCTFSHFCDYKSDIIQSLVCLILCSVVVCSKGQNTARCAFEKNWHTIPDNRLIISIFN